jgi:hypothetical protein
MSKCPLCTKENHCAIAQGEEPETCWCMKETIPQQLLEKASVATDQCICQKCVDDFNRK